MTTDNNVEVNHEEAFDANAFRAMVERVLSDPNRERIRAVIGIWIDDPNDERSALPDPPSTIVFPGTVIVN